MTASRGPSGRDTDECAVGSAEAGDTDVALRKYYAARASYYDAVYDKPERQRDIDLLSAWLPSAFRGRCVLEVACGTGYWTRWIARGAKSVVATDVADEPLEIARQRERPANVRFLSADAYALSDALGTFDAAFAGLWLSHVPMRKRPGFLASLHARLTPGAKVVLLDNSAVQCRELPIAEHDGDGNTYQLRELRDGSVHRVLKNFPSRAELEAMVAAQGRRPRYRELDNFWVFEYEVA